MATGNIRGVVAATLSPDLTQRRAAEAQIRSMERQTGYALTLLELIQKEPDVAVRMSSAVLFKNFVKTYWGEGRGKRTV